MGVRAALTRYTCPFAPALWSIVRVYTGVLGRPRGRNSPIRPSRQDPRVDDAAVGRALRAIRVARRRSQVQVADKAQVSRQLVGRVESGMIAKVDVGTVRAIAAALDATFDPVVRWHGGDMGRLINSRHSAMH